MRHFRFPCPEGSQCVFEWCDNLSVPMRDSCLNHEGTKTPRLIGSDWNDNVSVPMRDGDNLSVPSGAVVGLVCLIR